LESNPITDEGVTSLADWRRLQSLNLRGSRITDNSVPILGTLAGLDWLDCRETQITSSGLADLRQSLSPCRVNDLSPLPDAFSWPELSSDPRQHADDWALEFDTRRFSRVDLESSKLDLSKPFTFECWMRPKDLEHYDQRYPLGTRSTGLVL